MLHLPNFLPRIKRHLAVIALGSIVLVLTGCGDGSSSDSKTVTGLGGNQANQQASNFELKNTSGYALKSVRIMGVNGNELAQGALDCAIGATCGFQEAINVPSVFKFYDKNGTLVGAYILSRKPKKSQYIETSTTMLGLYVFNELRKRYPEEPDTLLSKVNRLFKNQSVTDGDSDKFEALGQYYRLRMVGSGLTDDQFFKELHDKLEGGAAFPVKSLSQNTVSGLMNFWHALQNVEWIASAQAAVIEKQECSPAIKQAGNLLSRASQYFSPASAIPGVIDAFCLNPQEQSLIKLNQIQAKLDVVSAKIDSLGQTIEVLKTFMGNTQAKAVWEEMVVDNDKLDNLIGIYKTLVGQGTLVDYVQQQGGIQKAYQAENFKTLISAGNIWGPLYTNIGSAPRQDRFAAAMNLLCDGANSPAGTDLVKNRTSCNALITKYKALVLSKNMQFLLILQDLMAAVESRRAQESAWITNNLSPIGGANVNADWSMQFNTVVKPALESNMAYVGEHFAAADVAGNAGFFKPLAGLPQALQDRLANGALKCSTYSNAAGTWVPNVTQWIKNGTNSYIAVTCNDGNSGTKVKSHYYYEQPYADTPINLLGVLVPSQGESSAVPVNGSLAQSYGIVLSNAWIRLPSSWVTNTADDYIFSVANSGSPSIGSSESGSTLLVPRPSENNSKVFYAHNSGISSIKYPRLYFRVKNPTSDLHYVGILSLNQWLIYSMGCLSHGPDCKVEGSDMMTSIRFTNGPSIKSQWSYTGDTINITLMQQ